MDASNQFQFSMLMSVNLARPSARGQSNFSRARDIFHDYSWLNRLFRQIATKASETNFHSYNDYE